MKKFIALFIGFLSIIGCAKFTDFSVNQNDVEITFNTNSKQGAQTRAIVTDSMVDNFGVFGYVLPGTFTEEGGYLMKNAEYEEDGTAANGEHYYWPKAQNNTTVDVIFTAYSQFTETPTFDETTGELTLTIPDLTQELIADPTNINDVLWAQSEMTNHQNADADATHFVVPLHFKHALSWLSFRAEVAENTAIKWVDIKGVQFGQYTNGQEYQPAVPGTPEIPEVPEQRDTTDTWVNLKNGTNAVATSTQTKAPGSTSYVNALALPAELVAEIKSYYSIDNSAAGDYDLRLGLSIWPKTIQYKQLRVVKEIPTEYKMTVDMHGEGILMDFFDAKKYLHDNGYDIQPGTSGGKPAVFNDNYVILDAYVNGAAYTITALNWGESNSIPNYTVNITPGTPAVPGTPDIPEVPAVPAGIQLSNLYIGGTLSLPTKEIAATGATLTEGTQAESFNFAPNAERLNGTSYDEPHNTILSNTLVIPQAVPEYVTLVFDICLLNATGDEIVFKNRIISRKINEGVDADGAHTYVASWLSSHKYIYNFKINVESIDFNVTVNGWDTNDNNNEYHVWDN